MAIISLLHPSRQRPEKSLETCRKWLERAGSNDVQLVISTDFDDPSCNIYDENFIRMQKAGHHVAGVRGHNRSAVDAINSAAIHAIGNIFIVLSDDTDCPYNWHGKIIEATRGKEDFVLRVNDEIQRWIITMPVIDREYYKRFGYVYYPEYKHMFCDTEFTHVADLLNRVIHRNDIHFPHHHYSVRKATKDSLNERCDATWNEGQELYIRRFKESFGLSDVDPWNISDDKHKHWLTQKV